MADDELITIQVSVEREAAKRAILLDDLPDAPIEFLDDVAAIFEALENADGEMDESDLRGATGVEMNQYGEGDPSLLSAFEEHGILDQPNPGKYVKGW